jgi:dTDP-4-amino-4,6-dideoxygalactose transaminase
MNMNVERVREALVANDRVKAIMPVHLAGQACDMDALHKLAKEFGVRIVEDAAHALPTTYKGRLVGSYSDIAVFSFYVTKTLATGEGGMIVTNDDGVAERIKVMRLHGISRDAFDRYTSNKPSWYYEIIAPGFKYNMPDISSAIGIHQLRKVRLMRDRREYIADKYFSGLAGLPLSLPKPGLPDDEHAWHLFIVQLDLSQLSICRDAFIENMAELGIGTSVHFIPLHLQPYWRDTYSLSEDDFPVASSVYRRVVSLPIYSKMSDPEIDRVVAAVKGIITANSIN